LRPLPRPCPAAQATAAPSLSPASARLAILGTLPRCASPPSHCLGKYQHNLAPSALPPSLGRYTPLQVWLGVTVVPLGVCHILGTPAFCPHCGLLVVLVPALLHMPTHATSAACYRLSEPLSSPLFCLPLPRTSFQLELHTWHSAAFDWFVSASLLLRVPHLELCCVTVAPQRLQRLHAAPAPPTCLFNGMDRLAVLLAHGLQDMVSVMLVLYDSLRFSIIPWPIPSFLTALF
jgi:hypothetical protein